MRPRESCRQRRVPGGALGDRDVQVRQHQRHGPASLPGLDQRPGAAPAAPVDAANRRRRARRRPAAGRAGRRPGAGSLRCRTRRADRSRTAPSAARGAVLRAPSAGKKPSCTIARTSAAVISASSEAANSAPPSPGTATCSGGPASPMASAAASTVSLSCRACGSRWPHCRRASRSSESGFSLRSSACASARSMLSPPSSRWSPVGDPLDRRRPTGRARGGGTEQAEVGGAAADVADEDRALPLASAASASVRLGVAGDVRRARRRTRPAAPPAGGRKRGSPPAAPPRASAPAPLRRTRRER